MQAINKKAHVLAEKMAKSKKLRGVVPREDPEALSVRKLLGEDLLEPPAMKQKELFTSLQTKPPRIKLVRPDTAERAAKSRWNKKNADAPEEGRGGVAYDKFTGEQVSDDLFYILRLLLNPLLFLHRTMFAYFVVPIVIVWRY